MGVFQGCTPGFWRNNLDEWVGFSPLDSFNATFGVDAFDPDITLQAAINLGGGGLNRLARHAVAALLNAANPDVNYPLTVQQVIDSTAAAITAGGAAITNLADDFEDFNELGCPL